MIRIRIKPRNRCYGAFFLLLTFVTQYITNIAILFIIYTLYMYERKF